MGFGGAKYGIAMMFLVLLGAVIWLMLFLSPSWWLVLLLPFSALLLAGLFMALDGLGLLALICNKGRKVKATKTDWSP